MSNILLTNFLYDPAFSIRQRQGAPAHQLVYRVASASRAQPHILDVRHAGLSQLVKEEMQENPNAVHVAERERQVMMREASTQLLHEG